MEPTEVNQASIGFEDALPKPRAKYTNCPRKKCIRFQAMHKDAMENFVWMRDQMWKTQSYAGSEKLSFSDEFRERVISHPAFAMLAVVTPGIAEIHYLKAVTDEATLRKDLQLLPTDIVRFVGVAKRYKITQE